MTGVGRWILANRYAAIIFVALLWAVYLRVAVLPLATGRVLSGDPASYVNIAQNLLAGDGITRDHSPVIGGLKAYYPPVYPLLLAAVGLVAPLSPPTFTFLHLLIDIITAAAMIWLADAMRLPRGVGAVAAAIYLLWPTNILLAPVPQKEGLATLFALGSLTLLIKRKPVAFGAVSGLLALTQPALVTLPAIAALLLYWRDGWLRFVLISASVAALVMLPWWVRNYALLGHFVPLTSASGITFWVGTMGDGIAYLPEVEKFTRFPETARSGAAFKEALAYIASDPGGYAAHTASKAMAMLQGDLWGAKPLFWMKPLKLGGFLLRDFPYFASFALFGLAAFGAVVTKHRILKLVLAACLIQLFAIQIWFQFSERHRYFLVPLLILIAVEGVRQLASMMIAIRKRGALA